ncbi:Uncharacterised protein [uncultured archaeon]|nr:Uncharacterised protein [uncultured archaeon]
MANATAKIINLVPNEDGLSYTATIQVAYNFQLVNTTASIPTDSLLTAGTLQTWMTEWLSAYKETLPSPDPHAVAYNGMTVSV